MKKRIIAVLAVLVGLVAVAAPARADSGEDSGCTVGHWPAEVQGRPSALKAGAPAGLYAWHDDDGWHIAVTHENGNKMVFKGRVTSSGRIYGVGRRTEGRDVSAVTSRMRAVGFRFENFGYLDVLNFRTRCANKITISGTIDGKPITTDQVFLGANNTHPSAVPVQVVRVS